MLPQQEESQGKQRMTVAVEMMDKPLTLLRLLLEASMTGSATRSSTLLLIASGMLRTVVMTVGKDDSR